MNVRIGNVIVDEDKLCEYCGRSNPSPRETCEGRWCEEKLEEYLDVMFDEWGLTKEKDKVIKDLIVGDKVFYVSSETGYPEVGTYMVVQISYDQKNEDYAITLVELEKSECRVVCTFSRQEMDLQHANDVFLYETDACEAVKDDSLQKIKELSECVGRYSVRIEDLKKR